MQEKILNYLRCPTNGGILELKIDRKIGDEIIEGRLISGSHIYPIIKGVPRLLTDEYIVNLRYYHKTYFSNYPEISNYIKEIESRNNPLVKKTKGRYLEL